MAKKRGELIGHIDCPTCGFPEMEVRPDKNGNPYAWCPDCTQQILTHGGERAEKMLARVRKIGQKETPAAEPVKVPEKKRAGTLLG